MNQNEWNECLSIDGDHKLNLLGLRALGSQPSIIPDSSLALFFFRANFSYSSLTRVFSISTFLHFRLSFSTFDLFARYDLDTFSLKTSLRYYRFLTFPLRTLYSEGLCLSPSTAPAFFITNNPKSTSKIIIIIDGFKETWLVPFRFDSITLE